MSMRLKIIGTICAVVIGSIADPAAAKTGGMTGGVELTLFDFYARQGAGGTPTNTNDYYPDYDLSADARIWFGYEGESGVGLRSRIWEWEESRQYLGQVRSQDFEVYDIEATFDSHICTCDLTLFGGLRWASISLDGSDNGGLDAYNFAGTGATIGFDLRRPLFSGEKTTLSAIGSTRYSLLYGDVDYQPVSPASLDGAMVDVKEIRMGLELARPARTGGRIFASATWEQQMYGTDSYYSNAIDPETPGDVSLGGIVFAVGLDR